MPQPLVLVSSNLRIGDGHRWHAVAESYLRAAIEGSGAAVVMLPALPQGVDLGALLDRVDGVLLTGSRSNVHPARYGTAPSLGHEPYDLDRDATDFPLIDAALARGKPMLCICRGMQELNVALGGTLATEIQELEGRLDHRERMSELQEERYAIQHPIEVTPGGLLQRVVGATRIEVNSLHRQAIDRLGTGLAVEATAADGTIEAVSVAGSSAFVLGVQWHPEYWFRTDAPSAAIFRAFGEAIGTK